LTLEGSDPVRLDGAPAAGAGWRDAGGASPLADSMITDTVPEATTPLAIARALAPRIRERAAEIEATRQLPRELVLEIGRRVGAEAVLRVRQGLDSLGARAGRGGGARGLDLLERELGEEPKLEQQEEDGDRDQGPRQPAPEPISDHSDRGVEREDVAPPDEVEMEQAEDEQP